MSIEDLRPEEAAGAQVEAEQAPTGEIKSECSNEVNTEAIGTEGLVAEGLEETTGAPEQASTENTEPEQPSEIMMEVTATEGEVAENSEKPTSVPVEAEQVPTEESKLEHVSEVNVEVMDTKEQAVEVTGEGKVTPESADSEKYKGPVGPLAPGPSTVPADRDQRKRMILRQVEFYLGVNLAKDEFLFTKHDADPEHWIPLDLVCTFKRMRRWTDRDEIVEALRESPSLLEVSDDGTKVRRKTPLVWVPGVTERSVYIKGFPEETESLQDELDDFFPQFGEVNEVRFRRTEGRVFKGSVFVEFKNVESAKNLLGQKDVEFKGHTLSVMSKEEYCNMKMKEKGISKETRHSNEKRPFNAFREMQRKTGAAKGGPSKGGKGKNKGKQEPEVAASTDPAYVPGCLARFKCPAGAAITWFAIKTALRENEFQVRFISFDQGSETTGVCQLQKPEAENLVNKFKESGMTVNEKKVEFENFEEGFEDLWYKAKRSSTAAKQERGKNGGRGGRGGQQGKKFRDRGENNKRRGGAAANGAKSPTTPACAKGNDDEVTTAENAVGNGKRKAVEGLEEDDAAKKAKVE